MTNSVPFTNKDAFIKCIGEEYLYIYMIIIIRKNENIQFLACNPSQHNMHLLYANNISEQVSTVEFDKFLEGDIITFKEGISREVSCSSSQSIPVADVSIKVAGTAQSNVKHHTEVGHCLARKLLIPPVNPIGAGHFLHLH